MLLLGQRRRKKKPPKTFVLCFIWLCFMLLFRLFYSLLFLFCYSLSQQARKKWSTRHDNGTKNASLAVYAKIPLEPNLSYRKNRKSTALAVMRRNMRPDASNVARYGTFTLVPALSFTPAAASLCLALPSYPHHHENPILYSRFSFFFALFHENE